MKKTIFAMISMIGMLILAFNVQSVASLEPPATEWSQTYGGTSDDVAWSVVQTSDGGYAIAGWTDSFGAGGSDFWLVKADVNGNMQWNKTYGGNSEDYAYSVVQTSDGGYVIAGQTSSTSDGRWDMWLIKIDANGQMAWNKTYGGLGSDEMLRSMIKTADGGYALAGALDNPHYADVDDFLLVKTDANGNMMWNRTYGGTGWEFAVSVVQTEPDGGYALIGPTRSFGNGGLDFWFVKTDSAGSMQWNKTYGGTNDDYATSLVQTSEGGYAIVGETSSSGAGSSDFWLVKTDAEGNMQWNETYGGTSYDIGWSVIQTSDGGYAIAGWTDSFGAGGSDFWLVKTDAEGRIQWNQTYGGISTECAYSTIQTHDKGYAIAGYTASFSAGAADFWLVKLAPEIAIAMVDIDPDALNLKSQGKWISGYIELPEGYDVTDINVSTIMLNGTVQSELRPTAVGDYDNDGVPDLMVKFDRATVVQYILDHVPNQKTFVTLTITGKLNDGTAFQGSDTIKIIYAMSKCERLDS